MITWAELRVLLGWYGFWPVFVLFLADTDFFFGCVVELYHRLIPF